MTPAGRECPGCGWLATPGAGYCRRCGTPLGAKPPRSRQRMLAALALAVLVGLAAGIVAVIAIDDDQRSRGPAGVPGVDIPADTASPDEDPGLDPLETVLRHFGLLEAGSYLTASYDLTPDLLDSLGGRTVWIAGQAADPLIDVGIDAEQSEKLEEAATVTVYSLRTESLFGGCTEFNGAYELVRSGDRWLIDAAPLDASAC